MAILGQILARLGHFWALPKIFRNGSDHHRFQHKKYCGFGKFELLRRQSRRFSNPSTLVPHYLYAQEVTSQLGNVFYGKNINKGYLSGVRFFLFFFNLFNLRII